MGIRLFDLFRSAEQKADRYSRELQAARVRAAHQQLLRAGALQPMPVETDLIGSMANDSHWRLLAMTGSRAHRRTKREPAHPRGEPSVARSWGTPKAAGIGDERRWNTAGDCEINDDLTPRDCRCGRSTDARHVWTAERRHRRATTDNCRLRRSGQARSRRR